MHRPAAPGALVSMMVRALTRLIGSRPIATDSAQIQPCERDACVSIRAARAAHHARRLDAETKSRILLREWLSPEQLAQLEGSTYFEVVGSKTGKRYRIHHGRQQNVYELNERGHRIRGRCFMPDGGLALATGDVMLTQKIALETDEEGTMKVALRFWEKWG